MVHTHLKELQVLHWIVNNVLLVMFVHVLEIQPTLGVLVPLQLLNVLKDFGVPLVHINYQVQPIALLVTFAQKEHFSWCLVHLAKFVTI